MSNGRAGRAVSPGGGNAWLDAPHQIRLSNDGAVWVVDAALHVVRKFTREGKLLLTLGTPGEAGKDQVHFNTPTDVAVTASGDAFVTDGYRNSRVVHFDRAGHYVKAWGKLGSQPSELSLPHSIVTGATDWLYVAERANARIQVFDQQGRFVDAWTSLVVPWGLGVNRDGHIWVCGSSPAAWQAAETVLGTPPQDQLLIKFDPYGKALAQWYVPSANRDRAERGELHWVHCIAEDSQGNLYCGDVRANRVLKFIARAAGDVAPSGSE